MGLDLLFQLLVAGQLFFQSLSLAHRFFILLALPFEGGEFVFEREG